MMIGYTAQLTAYKTLVDDLYLDDLNKKKETSIMEKNLVCTGVLKVTSTR
jgi:hypothetical protein